MFYVRDLQTSLVCYRDGVGLRSVTEAFGGAGAALTGDRTHRKLLLNEAGDMALCVAGGSVCITWGGRPEMAQS